MALPAGGRVSWPPESEASAYLRYGESSAWYSGSAAELERFYAGYAGQDRTGFFDPKTTAQPYTSIWRRFAFWARQDPGAIQRGRLHVPIAADIAATSSDLLFSDEPDFIIPEAHVEKATKKAKAAQDEVNEALEVDHMLSTLSEAAEVCAALGGVFLRCTWDTDFADHPLLDAKHPDAAVPEFRWGRLNAVTFWQVIASDSKTVLRLLERHERGHILHGLYRGTNKELGEQVSLSTAPEAFADLETDLPTGLDQLTAVYIPNLRPNRADRRSYLGRSDWAGAEGMMDALDETWTSWMREIRLGKARLIVPQEYLVSLGKGKGGNFDMDREVYEGINMNPNVTSDPIKATQFHIRVAEHQETAETLVERIVAASGYSAGTFGLSSKNAAGTEKTATEVRAREHRSIVTRGKKQQYWSTGLADILEVWLLLNEQLFKGPAAMRPRADFPDAVHESSIDLANTVQILRGATLLSLKTGVVMAHPDWDPDEVNAEVQAIMDEKQAAGPTSKASPTSITGTPSANPLENPPPGPAQRSQPPVTIPATVGGPQPMPPEAGGVPPPATGSAINPAATG